MTKKNESQQLLYATARARATTIAEPPRQQQPSSMITAAHDSSSHLSQEEDTTTTDTTTMIPWADELSLELWFHILCFVPPIEILESIGFVSKMFRSNVIQERSFWEQVTNQYFDHYRHSNVAVQQQRKQQQQQDDTNVEKQQQSKRINNFELVPLLSTKELQKLCLVMTNDDDNTQNSTQNYSNNNNCEGYHNMHLNKQSVLVNKQKAVSIIRSNGNRSCCCCCLASSTDNNTESLENTLLSTWEEPSIQEQRQQRIPLDDFRFLQHLMHQCWWSSKPTPDQNSTDTLLFATKCRLAILFQFSIRPLKDPFGQPIVYSWQFIIVRAYRLPETKLEYSKEEKCSWFLCSTTSDREEQQQQQQQQMHQTIDSHNILNKDQHALNYLLHGEEPVWESKLLPYTGPNSVSTENGHFNVPCQKVSFPTTGGGVVVANAVSIELIGKNNRQFPESGYFACVDHVELVGMALST